MFMCTRASKTVANYFVALRRLRSIKRSVSQHVLLSLVTVLTMSRLDYGSATMVCIPGCLMNHLQSVLNAGTRLVCDAGKTTTSHICFETYTGCEFLNESSSDWPQLSSAAVKT